MDSDAPTSRLCKPLSAILKDSGTLSVLDFFIQYMERENALHLLQFWFAVESFKTVASSPNCGLPNHVTVNYYREKSARDSTTHSRQCEVVAMESEMGMKRCRSETTTSVNRNQVDSFIGHEGSPCDLAANIPVVPQASIELTNTQESVAVRNTQERDKRSAYSVPAVEGRRITHNRGSTSLNGQSLARTVMNDFTPSGMQIQQRLLKQLSLNSATDALSIYTTYIALNALSRVAIPDELRQEIEVNICPEDGKVKRSCFDKAQAYIYRSLEQRYYPGFLTSHELCRYQYEYISSGKLCLLDFLLGDNALFYFMEYMEQESSSTLVQFWLTAKSFRTQLSNPLRVSNIERDTSDAIAIYERYFSLQASTPLTFGDTIRMDIENKICDECGPRADSYQAAQRHAYDLMIEFHFPGFLKSSVYLRFLNELVVMLNKPATSASLSSDGASQDHQSSSTHQEKPSTVNQLDFAQNLDDPDSLWQRPTTMLRLGYVDEFGQYISEITPIPGKSLRQKGDLSKKIYWLGKSRDEEEIAMKIARTIVQEVLSGVYRTESSPCT